MSDNEKLPARLQAEGQRAEQRNRTTAQVYDALGLAEYEAIEAFVRWTGDTLGIL